MPATATLPKVADYFVNCLRPTIGYAELLVKDIPPAKFAHKPHPTMNHPAFIIGHLSLYPNKVFTVLSQPRLIVEKPGFAELFQAGVQCVEQEGRYPGKDEIVAYYLERHKALIQAMGNVSDEALARENPIEGRLKEKFPLVGIAVNFLLNNHHMSHLGQLSAWRRAMGLPSVM